MPYPGGRLRDGSASPPHTGCILSNWGLTVLKGDGEWERLPSSLPSLEYLPLKCEAYIPPGDFWCIGADNAMYFLLGRFLCWEKKSFEKS